MSHLNDSCTLMNDSCSLMNDSCALMNDSCDPHEWFILWGGVIRLGINSILLWLKKHLTLIHNLSLSGSLPPFHSQKCFEIADIAGPANYFTLLKYVPFSAVKKLGAMARSLERGLFTHEKDAHKLTLNTNDCKDMIDFFLKEVRENESKEGRGETPNSSFKEEFLPSLIGDIFAAGTDTTACAMYWVMLFSIKYPKVSRHRKKKRRTFYQQKSFSYPDCRLIFLFNCATLLFLTRLNKS